MKDKLKEVGAVLLGLWILGNVVGAGASFFDQEGCSKLRPFKDVWNRPSKTTTEKLFTKPLAIMLSPGIYFGHWVATPGICKEK